MAEDASAKSFWRFSLMIYTRAGVAEALLRLQDRGGHNVNLILFGLWLAACGGHKLDAAALTRAAAAIASLDCDVVAPLRRLRRALKGDLDPDFQDMRRRVLALELAAERRVQARLAASVRAQPARTAARTTDRAALTEANLRLILGADLASAEAAVIRRALSRV
jgi:uncharacterized protein (TIGR02444 family)